MCKAVKLLTTLTKEDSIKSSIWFSLIFISVLLLPSYQAHSQPSKEFKKIFLKAEGYFFYEDDYKLAIPLYLRLLGMDSENANINYKIGVCYLETPGRKKEAIPYLEKSTHNISSNFQEGNYKERSAPVNAYFFLAHAYQVNNRLDEAISTYEKFLTHLDVKEYYEIDYVKLQIDACKRAKVQQSYSLDIKAVRLSSTINAHNKNQNPVVSGDGMVMVYTANVDAINRIYMTTQKDNQWTIPIDISDQLESKGDCISSSLSNDGKTLLLYKSDNKVGNLYISYFRNGNWGKIEKLKNINTKYWEANACISPDGKTLYFASNRKGGIGGLDLYKSELTKNGDWGPAINLGPTINSPYHENYPQIIGDGKTLYFSSLGHATIGGFDIFYSKFTRDGLWTEPLNIGYPVNTTDDNIYYMPISDGSEAYYAKYPDFESDKLEIYHYMLLSGAPLSKIEISGDVLLEDNMQMDSGIIITVLDSSFSKVIDVISPDPVTGKFTFSVPPGTFKLKISAEGYETENKILSMQTNSSLGKIELKSNLKSSEVAQGEYIVIKNIYFDYNSYQLNREAKIELERIINILNQHLSFSFELVGHTDSKGPVGYNLSLSGKRSKSVADYMINRGINPQRFQTKGLGESQHIAINVNPDGSDNPEGRRFNRRVRINIMNPGSEITLKKEVFIPEHLRYKGSIRYDIILKHAKHNLPLDYFSNFGVSELEKISEIQISNGYIYVLSGYNNYVEAMNQIKILKKAGLKEATLLNRQKVENINQEGDLILLNNYKGVSKYIIVPLYTIQIAASKVELNLNKFSNLENVKVTKGKNNYFRYSSGNYEGYNKAKSALVEIHKIGYPNAFIKAVKDLSK